MAEREDSMAKRQKLDMSEDLTVLVGPDEKRFVVHKCFITKSSEFFKAATRGDWKEVKAKIIKLPEVKSETFNIYLQWLYTGLVSTGVEVKPKGADDVKVAAFTTTTILIELYVFGDIVRDAKLRNGVIDSIFELYRVSWIYPGHSSIEIVWQKLPATSNMRRLILDWWVTNITVENFEGQHNRLPKEFCIELLKEFIQGSSRRAPENKGRCEYHEHYDENPTCV